jgi:hypothetical protein
MEIHAPEGPILSGRHLAVQLATITIGILIALSLEGVTGWFHHRALVREARANILSEIGDNKRELDGALHGATASEQHLNEALRLVNDLLARKKSDIHTVTLVYVGPQLSSASRNTAEATGALGYMEYTEVKRYAAAYELQQQYMRLQDRLLESWIPMLHSAQGDPDTLSQAELMEWKRQLLTSLSYVQSEASIGKSLSAEYEKILGAPR